LSALIFYSAGVKISGFLYRFVIDNI